MRAEMNVQRRSLCTWTGTAIGFRAFYAVIVDGGQLFGSAWLAVLTGLLFSLPVAASMIGLRRNSPAEPAGGALTAAAGKQGRMLVGLVLYAVLTYDAGAVISLMSSTAKYVAMPEANKNLIQAVTAAAAAAAGLMGASAAADAALLWRRLMAVLIAVLILTQAKYFRISWLMPVLGPGLGEIWMNSLPAAGIFSFAAGSWLMLENEQDKKGRAILKSVAVSGMITVLIAMAAGMLAPGMLEEPPTRSFRIGRLLANDRAGLTLEMPYVVLLYGGMFTMLFFETAAAARALRLAVPSVSERTAVWMTCIPAFLLSVSPWTERELLRIISGWYYPLIGVPVCTAGIMGWIRLRRHRKAGEAI